MGRIDYVIPMVFDDDPLWRSDFMRLKRIYHESAYYAACWRSLGTERLLVKAIRRFMPWVGVIHILLARKSQVRDWMMEEDVHIVYHRGFIPSEYLPTFNANTIEMFLHRIPGLSERFIYGNDDIYPLSPLKEECFFDGDVPCQIYTLKDFVADANIFKQFTKRGFDMISADFGKRYEDKILNGGHSLSPFLKSTFEKVWKLHKDEILSSLTPERSPKNYNQYIFAYYQHFSKNYKFNIPFRMMVSLSFPIDTIEELIASCEGVLCVNDYERVDNFGMRKERIYHALEQRILKN